MPIPPHIKKLYQAEEDDREFVLVVSGNGNGADEYNNCNNEAEDGGEDCKPATLPPSGSGICISQHDNDNCKEMTMMTPTAMASKDSWDATTGGSHAPSALRHCLTSWL